MRWSYTEFNVTLSVKTFQLPRYILDILRAFIYIAYVIIYTMTCGSVHVASLCCAHLINLDVWLIHEALLEIPSWNLESRSVLTSRITKSQSKRESLRSDPVPLPRRKKRRLSSGIAIAQLQSPFLQAPLLEIRQTIYK